MSNNIVGTKMLVRYVYEIVYFFNTIYIYVDIQVFDTIYKYTIEANILVRTLL